MIYLGLLLAIAWVPTWTGAVIPTQWAVLSCLGPLALWREGGPSRPLPSVLGVFFLAYAWLGLLWTENPYDAGWGLWLLSATACAFWFGFTVPDLRRIYVGLAVGLTISSFVSVWQWLGFTLIPSAPGAYAGLFYSGVVHGAVLALVVVGLLCHRLYWYIPLLLPGLILSQSRGAWVAVAVGAFASVWRKPLTLLIIGLAVVYIATYKVHLSDTDRLFHWSAAWNGIKLLGWGPGSFLGVFIHETRGAESWALPAGWAHNDYLQLAFEFGIGALPLYALYLLTLSQTQSREWPVFVVFATLGLFFFPLYLALPAAIGAACAGNIARDWSGAWASRLRWRFDFLSWRHASPRTVDQPRSGAIPFQPRASV